MECLHYNLWIWNTGLYAFMWQNLTTIYVNFIFYNDIFAQNGNALHTHPTSDCWSPTNYTAVKPCMAFNNCTFQNCGTLDTGTCGKIDRFSILFSKNTLKTKKNRKIWNIPSSTTQFGPIVTFGPIRHPLPSFAVGCTNTFPTIVRFSAEHWYNFDASFWRNELKYKHIPEIKMWKSKLDPYWTPEMNN